MIDELERNRWVRIVEDLISGEYAELLFPDVRRAKHAMRTCVSILRDIDLPFDAHYPISDMWVKVCWKVRFLPNTSMNVHNFGWRPR